MSRDTNSVTEVGNLTRDPDLRFTGSGAAVTKLSLAVNYSRQVNGKWEDKANFFDVTCFGQLAENVAESLTKGDRIVVTGRLDWDSWEDRNGGGKRSKVQIIADAIGAEMGRAVVTVNRNARQAPAPAQAAATGQLSEQYDYDEEPF
jgi:single-strand DNA-binding protein